MRRRLAKFLPIVLIALMVQILAPIGACWAAAFGISDPLLAVEICHSNPASTSGQTDQSGEHHAHDGACSIYCAAQASASFDIPQATAVATPSRKVHYNATKNFVFDFGIDNLFNEQYFPFHPFPGRTHVLAAKYTF
jgi:DUF2946 family protein